MSSLVNPEKAKRFDPHTGLALEYGEYIVKFINERLRQVLLIGPINEPAFAATNHTLEYLAALSKKPITVLMDTYGGDINSGMAIYDMMRRVDHKCPVNIKATGACMSMGVVILQAGRKRLATPHANFMLHQLRGVNEGVLGELRDRHRHMERLQHQLDDILIKRTGLTQRELTKLTERRDYYITAEEALNLNLIDGIVED